MLSVLYGNGIRKDESKQGSILHSESHMALVTKWASVGFAVVDFGSYAFTSQCKIKRHSCSKSNLNKFS